jgi:hypothetical protein
VFGCQRFIPDLMERTGNLTAAGLPFGGPGEKDDEFVSTLLFQRRCGKPLVLYSRDKYQEQIPPQVELI